MGSWQILKSKICRYSCGHLLSFVVFAEKLQLRIIPAVAVLERRLPRWLKQGNLGQSIVIRLNSKCVSRVEAEV